MSVIYYLVLLLFQELNLILSQPPNVTFENATNIKYLTSMNDQEQYHQWFCPECSITSYKDSDNEYFWLSVGGCLNDSDQIVTMMSDIYDINMHHYNNPNLPFVMPETVDGIFRPILGTSAISNNIIQCYLHPVNDNNESIHCVIYNQTTKTLTNPFIVSITFPADWYDPFGQDTFWGFDVLGFDDDTFFIAYIASNSLFYTLLHSNGTIITFNKLLYHFDGNNCCLNDGLFLIKSYYNLENKANFINSFLLYYTNPLSAIGIWTGTYSEDYSLILNEQQPIHEMVTSDTRCAGQKPILLSVSSTCCYILAYHFMQWNEIDYIVINATGDRVILNDYILFPFRNNYATQELITLQHKSTNYFLSLTTFYDDNYLNLYAYIFNLSPAANTHSYNTYQLNIIRNQTFVQQPYDDSNDSRLAVYGFCNMLSHDNEQLLLSWVVCADHGNMKDEWAAHIYAQSFNISWS